MKKLFAALLLSIGLTPAWAEWVQIDESDDYEIYLNAKTLGSSGGNVRAWLMFNRKSGKNRKLVSSVELEEVNCKTRQRRTIQFTAYSGQMGQGKAVESRETPTAWLYSAPGTLADYTVSLLCDLSKKLNL